LWLLVHHPLESSSRKLTKSCNLFLFNRKS
jgi:hypothetical protein